MCLSDIMLAVRVFAGRFEQAVAASSGPGGRPEATSGSEQAADGNGQWKSWGEVAHLLEDAEMTLMASGTSRRMG